MEIINYLNKLIIFIYLLYSIQCEVVVISPSDLAARYYNKPIEINFRKSSDLTNFYIQGEVIFENKTNLHTSCDDLGNLLSNKNQNDYSKILLAYNGECSIIQKVRNAQEAGASMLLLINNNDQDIKHILIEDYDPGNDIKIPVGLISLANGRIMQNYIENNPKSNVMVEIIFNENTDKKKIDFKLFFSSSELRAYELIHNLTKYLDKFEDQVNFIPIYVSHQSPSYNPQKPQRELNCVSRGKYCYFPKQTTIIQDGQRILMESLRQKCMFRKNRDNLKKYYEYLHSFFLTCLGSGIKFNERCAKQTLDNLGYPVNYLDACLAGSFGVSTLLSSSYIDNENLLFQKDYKEILKYKLTGFPAVVIDDKPLNGVIKEGKIINKICEAIKTKPEICQYFIGDSDDQINKMNRRKYWVFLLIIIIIIINICLFLTFRKYIMLRIGEKMDFNTIDVEGRINNVLHNFMSLKKNQELDYKSFDTDSSKQNSNKIEVVGTVDTL